MFAKQLNCQTDTKLQATQIISKDITINNSSESDNSESIESHLQSLPSMNLKTEPE
jgi:hypothetical protein